MPPSGPVELDARDCSGKLRGGPDGGHDVLPVRADPGIEKPDLRQIHPAYSGLSCYVDCDRVSVPMNRVHQGLVHLGNNKVRKVARLLSLVEHQAGLYGTETESDKCARGH